MLKKPRFTEYDDLGHLAKLFCKMCGAEIAGTILRPQGSGPGINVMVPKFMRFPNYSEIKMQFNDGSFHVTHGCKECLLGLTKADLLPLYKCDMAEMGMLAGARKPLAVVARDHTAQGIV